jgi:membrane protein implicated in regulation of membrane protease activity
LPVIYGRSIRHLIIVWIVALACLALLHFFETSAPAFHELLIPFYWITVAVAAVLTWRWLRSRSTTDRRRTDRRRAPRRGDHASSQAADPDLSDTE